MDPLKTPMDPRAAAADLLEVWALEAGFDRVGVAPSPFSRLAVPG